MPHKEIIDFLVGKTGLNNDACVKLVMLRKQSIMRNIKQLGQAKLVDVRHGYGFPSPNFDLEIQLDTFNSRSADLNLSCRGIFIYDEMSYASEQKQQSLLVYGFTRDGRWVEVNITFEVGLDRWTFENKKKVIANYTTIDELIGKYGFLTPMRMFEALGKVVDEHVKTRHILLREAEVMQRECEMEDELLTHIYTE